MADWWDLDEEERGEAKGGTGQIANETGAAKPLGLEPVPEGQNLEVANWLRRMQPHLRPLEQPPTPPGMDPLTPEAEPNRNFRPEINPFGPPGQMGEPAPPLGPPGMAKGPGTPAPPAAPETSPPAGVGGNLTSQVAGPEGFTPGAPPQRPVVPMGMDPWRGLHQQLANLTVAEGMPGPEKLRRLQALLQQRDAMSQQMGQQGQARQAQMREFQEIQAAQQAFAPRSLSQQEMIHFQETAQAQIPMPGRPKQWNKQSAGQYNLAVRQWQQRVQAQVQQWASMEMQNRKLASQQQFGAWQKERAEDRKDARQFDREEARDSRQFDRQEQATINAEKRAAAREKAKAEADEKKLAQDAERQQEKDFEKAVQEDRDRSQQQRMQSFQRHLAHLEKDQDKKRDAWIKGTETDRARMGEFSEVPRATLVQEARRRALEEEKQFSRREVGSRAWQNDQEGGEIAPREARPAGEPGDDFGGPERPRLSPADQAKAFGEMIRKAILGR